MLGDPCARALSELSEDVPDVRVDGPFADHKCFSDVAIGVAASQKAGHLAFDFARMQPASLLINTSRGEVVDEEALRAALESGQVAGAGSDVLEDESGRNPLADLSHVVVTPHIAGRSRKSAAAAMQIALGNINRYIQDQSSLDAVPGMEVVSTLVETR